MNYIVRNSVKHDLFYAVLLVISLSDLLMAQPGKVFDNLFMKSVILQSDRKYAVYLPPDYETSQRSYPVLYLLHGGGDDQTGWIQFGEVLYIADKAIHSGLATPMVIIMPDANTARRGYWNDIQGKWRYEDFFFEEFIPYIEKTYHIKAEKRYRAIAGLSMGGEGTFLYALHHPELFSSACPLSAGTGPNSLEQLKDHLERYTSDASANLSDSLLTSYYKGLSALYLVEQLPDEQKRSVRWYIDCGDDDFLYEGNSLVHIEMRKREIPHEYRVRNGTHNWTYWREALPDVLSFISDTFHQH